MGFILNQGQQTTVEAAVNWFKNSSEQTFQIAGNAGVGKTVCLNEILRRLNLKEDEILPMAYTGQACSVMKSRGINNACTCHSGLFHPVKMQEVDEYGRVIMHPTFNIPLVTWHFIPKDFSTSNIKLIILDEAWMIPKRFKQHIDNTGIKVLATGDPGQLPPVMDNPGYLVDGTIYYLTELMRQSENSPIIYLANRARTGLPIEPGMYGSDVMIIFDDDLNDDIMSRSNIILCGKNSTREDINNRVRHNILGIDLDYPFYGERIICRKNNWDKCVGNMPLVNGLVGTVITPPDIGKFNGDIMKLDFLPDTLSIPFINLEVNYKYLNASHKEKEDLKMNPYLIGERFEYAYCSTVHLAQGSEYNSGIYIEEFLKGDIQNALNYTAITRFKQKMIYVKSKPKFISF